MCKIKDYNLQLTKNLKDKKSFPTIFQPLNHIFFETISTYLFTYCIERTMTDTGCHIFFNQSCADTSNTSQVIGHMLDGDKIYLLNMNELCHGFEGEHICL